MSSTLNLHRTAHKKYSHLSCLLSEASDSCNAAVVACFYENILPISQTALLLIITKCEFLLPSFFLSH